MQLDGFVCFLKRAEKRRSGFAHLEIDGAIFDLQNYIGIKLAVEIMEIIVGGAGAVVFQIVPVEVMVVNESAIEQQAAVRLERAGDHVGCVGMRAAICGRTDAAFGIGLQDETREIGNRSVNLPCFLLPPFDHARVERIVRVETADRFGAAEINRDGNAHCPRDEMHRRRGQAAEGIRA